MIVDIGEGVGAAVIHTQSDLEGAEPEIGPRPTTGGECHMRGSKRPAPDPPADPTAQVPKPGPARCRPSQAGT